MKVRFFLMVAALSAGLLTGCGNRYPQFSGVYRLQQISVTGAQNLSVPLPNSLEVETLGRGSYTSPHFDLHFRFFEDADFTQAINNRNAVAPFEGEITESLSSLFNCPILRETEDGGRECVTAPLVLPGESPQSLSKGCSYQMVTTLNVVMSPDPGLLDRYYSTETPAEDDALKNLESSVPHFEIVMHRAGTVVGYGCQGESSYDYIRTQVQANSYTIRMHYRSLLHDRSLDPFSVEARHAASQWRSTPGLSGLVGYFGGVFNQIR